MTRIVYVNGAYRRASDAQINVEDRGFQFADAVYEVIEVHHGRLIDEARHLDRLFWSLTQLEIPSPMARGALSLVIARVVRRNRVRDGIVYLQVSRGVARRDFIIPGKGLKPSLVVMARTLSQSDKAEKADKGIRVVTAPDPRWARCDIKTVMLLPASLAKTQAQRERNAEEVWFVDADGFITEGGSSTAWIVDQAGRLRTRGLSRRLLPGVTRATLLDVCQVTRLEVAEEAFTPEEAKLAQEAFITAASSTLMPVVMIDEAVIGHGKPGPVSQRLRAAFHEVALTNDRGPMVFP